MEEIYTIVNKWFQSLPESRKSYLFKKYDVSSLTKEQQVIKFFALERPTLCKVFGCCNSSTTIVPESQLGDIRMIAKVIDGSTQMCSSCFRKFFKET